MSDDEDDKEEKLPTSEELPTSAGDEKKRKNAQKRDSSYDPTHSYMEKTLSEWKLQSAEFFADKREFIPGELTRHLMPQILSNSPDIKTDSDPTLHFSRSDLERFVEHRKTGLAPKSIDWINRATQALWESTHGEISHRTLKALREGVLHKYKSADSHSKVLSFAKGFLTFLSQTKIDPRYLSFSIFLEMPRAVKERKSMTERVVVTEDIKNVLAYIKRAEQKGELSKQRAIQYTAFVIFAAYSGQRSESTIAKLTVGQFRTALAMEKPVLLVESSQDKIRMAHFVPIHRLAIEVLQSLLDGRNDDERMFEYQSLLMWVKRRKIPMSKFKGHFSLGDERKYFQQQSGIVELNESITNQIMTHAVGTIDWKHYKNPLPENVYDVYMRAWQDVDLTG